MLKTVFVGSVYSVIAVAVERYFKICKPFNSALVCYLNYSQIIATLNPFLKGTFDMHFYFNQVVWRFK